MFVQFFGLSLFSWTSFTLFIVNLLNWNCLMRTLAVKYEQMTCLKLSLIKCQIVLALANSMKDDQLIPYLLPYLLIFNSLYIRYNWEDLTQLKSFLEAFILTSISIEMSTNCISSDSRLRSVFLSWDYASHLLISMGLLAILLLSQYSSNRSQSRLADKIELLETKLDKNNLYTAAMIHELRQPLNSVIGGVDLLCNSKCLSIDDKRNI